MSNGLQEWLAASQTLINVAQFAALVGAGLYFRYRYRKSELASNLSLTLNTTRTPAPGSSAQDWLSVELRLLKGDRGSILLEDMRAHLTYSNGISADPSSAMQNMESAEFLGYKRLSYVTDTELPALHRIVRFDDYDQQPRLRLPPGEQTSFAVARLVPRDACCEIEVVVLAKLTRRDMSPSVQRLRHRRDTPPDVQKGSERSGMSGGRRRGRKRDAQDRPGQWRASAISLPIPPCAPDAGS